jgi:hypothetical protein
MHIGVTAVGRRLIRSMFDVLEYSGILLLVSVSCTTGAWENTLLSDFLCCRTARLQYSYPGTTALHLK